MCGIIGFIDSEIGNVQGKNIAHTMLKSTQHRGPDYTGFWNENEIFLGHNRLSIIDLSSSSHQPFEFNNLVLTYNGEIYNYLELKKELIDFGYQFTTSSDTEVIAAAYDKWGENCVEKFVGMWAFAIWNKKDKSLFCSRDRFGIKPFYYIFTGSKFYFASEIKALKLTPHFNSELNINQINRGLQLGWINYNDETYFSSVKSLPAAHNITISNNLKLSVKKYWNIDFSKHSRLSFSEQKEEFREKFFDSIKLHMRSDVPIGACLSGGLDSSAIVSSISHLFPKQDLKTFTIYYEGKNSIDERPWANHVINQNKNIEAFYYSPTSDELEDSFEKMIYHFDVPPAGSSPISQYHLMKLASRNNIKVVLDGQGADEYLAGYNHTSYRSAVDYMSKFKFISAAKTLNYIARANNYSTSKLLSSYGKSVLAFINNEQSLSNFEYNNLLTNVSTSNKLPNKLTAINGGNRLNKFLYHLMFTTSLPSLLHYEDRNSMAFSIESRVPFLDHRLVEYAFSLPNESKFNKGISKYILRKSMQGIMPKEILERKDKKGFVTPGEVKWLRGSLKHLIDDYPIHKMDFLNQNKLKNVLDEYKKGDNKNAKLVWRLVSLNKWMDSI